MYLIILLVSCLISSISGLVPDYIHVCHRSDPHLNKCIIQSIEALRPKLVTGIPDLQVPGLEPLVLPEIVISGGNDGSNYKGVGRDTLVYGASDFQISKLKTDIPNLTFLIGVKFPILRFFSDIDISGRLFLTPFKGKGKLEANATNVHGNGVLKGEIINVNGENKMHFDLDLDLQSANINVKLSNLFGDTPLSKLVNDAITPELLNNAEFFKIYKPIAEQAAAKVLKEIANKIASNFNYDEIFPK